MARREVGIGAQADGMPQRLQLDGGGVEYAVSARGVLDPGTDHGGHIAAAARRGLLEHFGRAQVELQALIEEFRGAMDGGRRRCVVEPLAGLPES